MNGMDSLDLEVFKRKVLIIGLDGATWDIYRDIINKNYMPYLKKLKEEGAFGDLSSTIPPISPAAWGTIQTGREALNDNIYEFYCFDKETKQISIVNSKCLKHSIWEILSNLGKKVAVVNVPMTYPPKKVNGYIISGILTPSIDSDFTHPSNLKEEILKNIPDYQFHYSEDIRYGNPHFRIKEFVQERIKNLKDRTKLCVWLLNKFKIDIFMVNFQANDILQHVLWGYMDEQHDFYDKNIKEYTFQNFHKTLDHCIETIREEFIRNSPGELMTIILSDHGCESHKKQFFLGDWLYRQNLLTLYSNHLKLFLRRKFKEIYLKFSHSKIQLNLLNALRKLELRFKTDGEKDVQKMFLQDVVDWKHTRAFSMGIGLYGLIFLFGKDEDKKKLTTYLLKKLKEIKDTETGECIVSEVYLKEHLYKGDSPNLVPDLIIKPEKGYSFTGLFQNVDKLFQKIDRKRDFAIGKHSELGLLIINGKHVAKKEIDNASLKDIVPTILDYFQIPLMEDLEGKVINCFKN